MEGESLCSACGPGSLGLGRELRRVFFLLGRRFAPPSEGWRRGWDSNPRSPCGDTRFRGEPDRPLWHLSVKSAAGHIIIVSARLTRLFGRVAELADAPDSQTDADS